MPHREPTIRSRELGEGLRQAMEKAGLTGKRAAQTLNWSPAYVSMLLAGKRGASEVDIAAFLGMCRVANPERDRLLALCREQENPAGCSSTAPGYPNSSSRSSTTRTRRWRSVISKR